MTFDFDVFRVLVRSWEKRRIWIELALLVETMSTEETWELHKWNQLCSRSGHVQKVTLEAEQVQRILSKKAEWSDLPGGFCSAPWAGWQDLFLQH